MRIKTLIIKKPKTAFASLMAVTASSLLFIPSATAEDFRLDVQGEFIESAEEDSTRTRRFDTEIKLDFGSTVIFGLNGQFTPDSTTGQDKSKNSIISQDGRWFKLTADEVEIENGEKALSIRVSIIDRLDGEDLIFATPHIIAAYGETAEFRSEENDKTYSLAFLPQKNL